MPPKSDIRHASEALVDSFLAGEFAARQMSKRAAKHFIKPWRGLDGLIEKLVTTFGASKRPARRNLIATVMAHDPFFEWLHLEDGARFDFEARSQVKMHAAKGNPSGWQLPALTTAIELARWLHLNESELNWFARPWRGPAEHYEHHWIAKRRGGQRLIEKPKDALKLIQRQILHRILDHIPPHDAVHSFRAERNVISYSQSHCDQPLLLKLDIADFFPSLQAGRVRALFRTAGYPDSVADLLADLCCTSTPGEALPDQLGWTQKKRLQSPHLPQGAPTSPALSNLLGYRLDCRLVGLADSIGANYTRYADDLAFSGDHRVAKIAPVIGAILIEEGFAPNHRKTRLQRRSNRQRLAGTIVNSEKPNIARKDFDRLKAILHNFARQPPSGIDSVASRQQLQGKIAWVRSLNPNRAEKLQQLFDQVDW